MNPNQQLDINDLHTEYGQQIGMLSQRCALLAAHNGALRRANQEMEKEIATLLNRLSDKPVVD